jgi:hypothetical protein
MRYRRIIDGEPQFGQNKQDFLLGIDAVAQAIATRLKLFANEWWEDLEDGLPVWTKMLGVGQVDPEIIGLEITSRILGTNLNGEKLVPNMSEVHNEFDGLTRKFLYTGVAVSVYGEVFITNKT